MSAITWVRSARASCCRNSASSLLLCWGTIRRTRTRLGTRLCGPTICLLRSRRAGRPRNPSRLPHLPRPLRKLPKKQKLLGLLHSRRLAAKELQLPKWLRNSKRKRALRPGPLSLQQLKPNAAKSPANTKLTNRNKSEAPFL